MNQIIDSANSILAPLLAGVLYYPIGLEGIIILDLSSYIISIAIIIRIASSHFSKTNSYIDLKTESGKGVSSNSGEHSKSFLYEISAGFHFIFEQRSLTLLMIFFALLNFLFNLAGSLIEPLSLSVGNSMQLGFVKMCGGVGMLLGSLFITVKNIRMSYSKGILWSAGVAGAALIVMGIRDSVVTIALGRLVFSFVGPISSTIASTLWIMKTPKKLQGRVYSARIMVVRCIMPISYLLVGPLADQWIPAILKRSGAANLIKVLGFNSLNYRLVFMAAGSIVILCTLFFCFNSNFRRLDEACQ